LLSLPGYSPPIPLSQPRNLAATEPRRDFTSCTPSRRRSGKASAGGTASLSLRPCIDITADEKDFIGLDPGNIELIYRCPARSGKAGYIYIGAEIGNEVFALCVFLRLWWLGHMGVYSSPLANVFLLCPRACCTSRQSRFCVHCTAQELDTLCSHVCLPRGFAAGFSFR